MLLALMLQIMLLGHLDSYLKDMAMQVYSYMNLYMLSELSEQL